MTQNPTMDRAATDTGSDDVRIQVIDRDGARSEVLWETGQSLMEALRDNDFPVLASCGGTASCATCHVFLPQDVVEGLGERSEDELDLLEETDAFDQSTSRLSCQVERESTLSGIAVELAPEED